MDNRFGRWVTRYGWLVAIAVGTIGWVIAIDHPDLVQTVAYGLFGLAVVVGIGRATFWMISRSRRTEGS